MWWHIKAPEALWMSACPAKLFRPSVKESRFLETMGQPTEESIRLVGVSLIRYYLHGNP